MYNISENFISESTIEYIINCENNFISKDEIIKSISKFRHGNLSAVDITKINFFTKQLIENTNDNTIKYELNILSKNMKLKRYINVLNDSSNNIKSSIILANDAKYSYDNAINIGIISDTHISLDCNLNYLYNCYENLSKLNITTLLHCGDIVELLNYNDTQKIICNLNDFYKEIKNDFPQINTQYILGNHDNLINENDLKSCENFGFTSFKEFKVHNKTIVLKHKEKNLKLIKKTDMIVFKGHSHNVLTGFKESIDNTSLICNVPSFRISTFMIQ